MIISPCDKLISVRPGHIRAGYFFLRCDWTRPKQNKTKQGWSRKTGTGHEARQAAILKFTNYTQIIRTIYTMFIVIFFGYNMFSLFSHLTSDLRIRCNTISAWSAFEELYRSAFSQYSGEAIINKGGVCMLNFTRASLSLPHAAILSRKSSRPG